jgi:hypothetical protein
MSTGDHTISLDAASLWEVDGRLRSDLLVSGNVDDFRRYRAELTRGQDAFYGSLVHRTAGCPSYITLEKGVVRTIKQQIVTPKCRLDILRDELILQYVASYAEEFDRTMQMKMPVFVMVFITSPCPCNLPMGMYLIEGPLTPDRKTWKLARTADVYALPEVPSDHVDDEELHRGGSASTDSSLVNSVDQPAKDLSKVESRRFNHNGDEFDSMLECIHREAMRRLGVRYIVTRNVLQIGHLLPQSNQRQYTLDGLLYASLNSEKTPLEVFHVEIKPGPFTAEESERCRAVCRLLNQFVLCISGGYVCEAQMSGEKPCHREENSYGHASRRRLCVDMSLYAPNGPEGDPRWHPCVVWRFPDAAGTAPFLSFTDSSDPYAREASRVRILNIYHQATRDAVKWSRRSDVY